MSKYSKDQTPFQHLWMEGYPFRMGSYIRGGFDMLKAYPFGYLGHMLVFILAVVIVGIVGSLLSMTAIGVVGAGGIVVNQAVGWFISAFSVSFISGIYFVGNAYKRDNTRNFDGFFRGFNHFGQIFLYSATVGLIFFLMSLAAAKIVNFDTNALRFDQFFNQDMSMEDFPYIMEDFMASLGPDFYKKIGAFVGLMLLLSVYFRVAWSLTVPMIVLKNMRFWEAMEVSRKIVTRKWFHFFGFYILMGILLILASLLLGMASGFLISVLDIGIINVIIGLVLFIGILLIVPFAYLTQYAAFDDIVLEDEGGMEGMINDIGSDSDPDDQF